jgi:gas vesicle protein
MERDSAGRFTNRREGFEEPQDMSQQSYGVRSTGVGMAALIGGAALGTVAMYLFDPHHGAERRAIARNMAGRALESTGDVLHSTSQYAGSAWQAAKDKVAGAASAARGAMPSTDSVRDRASSWFESAKSYIPGRAKLERHSDYAMNPGAVSVTALSTLIIGAGAMWLFDPARGRARRAWIGQKLNRGMNEAGQFASATGRHLRNKMKGYYQQTSSAVRRVGPRTEESLGVENLSA